jgi:hypothetical protein
MTSGRASDAELCDCKEQTRPARSVGFDCAPPIGGGAGPNE